VELTKEDKKALAKRGYKDPVFFCKTFLPKLFPGRVPWVHRGLLAILTRKCSFLENYGEVDKIIKNFAYYRDGQLCSIFYRDADGKLQMQLGKYTLVMLPRGFSKTTIAGIAVPVYESVYHDTDFTCYVSETATHAEMQLANTKAELEGNQLILEVFGEKKDSGDRSRKWASEMFETVDGITMAARGRGGQIRGLNHKGRRPKKIICDDLEDKESVSTPEQRQKTKTWAYGDLMPALPRLDPNATIVALGTLLHQDALLQTWANDPDWTVVKLGALDADGEPVWPENMDLEGLERTKMSFARAGQLSTFYMEYHNQSVATEDQKFRKEYIQYAQPTMPILTAVYMDPAISKNVTADNCVIKVAGMEEKGKIFMLEEWAKRGASPREAVDIFFAMHQKYGCTRAGIESNAYQAALIHLVREEMFRKRHYFEITPVTHKTKKSERIEGILQPRYAGGYIFHAKIFPEYETDLVEWPNVKKDDRLDAAAGVIALLDPYAAHAAGDEDLTEDEYEPLDKIVQFGDAP